MDISSYKGPKVIETYLLKKKDKPNKKGERIAMRYFKFSLSDKSFSYRDDEDTKEIKMIYIGKDLISFVDSAEKDDLTLSPFKFGFQILTSGKHFVLFAETKDIYSKWIRILNFYFNKIDILNPAVSLSPSQTKNPDPPLKLTPTNKTANKQIATWEDDDDDFMNFGKSSKQKDAGIKSSKNEKQQEIQQTKAKQQNVQERDNSADKDRVNMILKRAMMKEEKEKLSQSSQNNVDKNRQRSVSPEPDRIQNKSTKIVKEVYIQKEETEMNFGGNKSQVQVKSQQTQVIQKQGASNKSNSNIQKNQTPQALSGEDNRVNMYLKKAADNEKKGKTANKALIQGGGGLSDDDEDLLRNIEKGMKRDVSKSPGKLLDLDCDFGDPQANAKASNLILAKKQPSLTNKANEIQQNKANEIQQNKANEIQQNKANQIQPNIKTEKIENNKVKEQPSKAAKSTLNEKQEKQMNNIQVQPKPKENIQMENNLIKFGGTSSNPPKKENFKEVWTDLNDFEVAMSKALENKNMNAKPVNPSVVSVNSLLKEPPKVRTFKLDTPMFDETQLHIRKAVFTKKLQVENLFIAPNMPTPEELEKEEEEQLKKDKKSPKSKSDKKSQLQQQNNQVAKNRTKKKQEDNTEKLKESDKIFDTSNKVLKDGQKFEVQKKIYMGQENNFTFQITVPQKMTEKKDDDEDEKIVDERVRIAKKKFEKLEHEKSIYLPGKDQENEKVSSILQQEERKPLSKKTQEKMNLGEQNQMQMTSQQKITTVIQSNQRSNNENPNIKFNNTNNAYRRISLEVEQPAKVIKDEQHMHVFKTFKVDTFTVVSDDYHQPLDKTVDVKTSQMIKANIKEEPKPESKFFEVKKDLIDKTIIKIERKKEPDSTNPDLGGGENQVPIAEVKELSENLNPSAGKEVSGLNLGGMGEFNMNMAQQLQGSKKPGDKKQSIISNFAPEEGNYNETMNLSRMSKFSKLDLEEVWDNSILGEDNFNILNNSLEYKNK